MTSDARPHTQKKTKIVLLWRLRLCCVASLSKETSENTSFESPITSENQTLFLYYYQIFTERIVRTYVTSSESLPSSTSMDSGISPGASPQRRKAIRLQFGLEKGDPESKSDIIDAMLLWVRERKVRWKQDFFMFLMMS